MSPRIASLYRVKREDMPRAAVVLADAFQHDPVWRKLLAQADIDTERAFFQAPVMYCSKYGAAYATSDRLEGIAAWVPGALADVTIARMVACGFLPSALGGGRAMAMLRVGRRMKAVFEPLDRERRARMRGRAYLYLMMIGVATQAQGRGLGGTLLRALIEESEQVGLPICLETATERNVQMYRRLGFTVLRRVLLPMVNLPQWEMIREPEALPQTA